VKRFSRDLPNVLRDQRGMNLFEALIFLGIFSVVVFFGIVLLLGWDRMGPAYFLALGLGVLFIAVSSIVADICFWIDRREKKRREKN
jgi:hypothetical protein